MNEIGYPQEIQDAGDLVLASVCGISLAHRGNPELKHILEEGMALCALSNHFMLGDEEARQDLEIVQDLVAEVHDFQIRFYEPEQGYTKKTLDLLVNNMSQRLMPSEALEELNHYPQFTDAQNIVAFLIHSGFNFHVSFRMMAMLRFILFRKQASRNWIDLADGFIAVWQREGAARRAQDLVDIFNALAGASYDHLN